MRRPTFALLLLVLLAPAAVGGGTEPYAPARVLSQAAGSASVVVEWLPGSEAADSYRVYGIAGGGASLLFDTTEAPGPLMPAVAVPSGYSAYGVAGVNDGVESALVLAGGPPCIYVQTDPPGVGELGCMSSLPRRHPPVSALGPTWRL